MKFYCRPKPQEKQHFGKSHFYCRRFLPGNTVTITLGNYPPSTLQGVGLGDRKNPRSIVGENCGYFGAAKRQLRKAYDTFNFLRHVMRAILSVRPKFSHRCVSLKKCPLRPVQILKHTTKHSTEQTSTRAKWFKHIAI